MNGDTVETETQVYNAANELTSQVVKGGTVSYAYDQFGRLTQKSKTGSRVANFYYNYGDKLTKVSSNFQGEGTVTYTYSGDQKRRSRSVSGGAMTKYRVDQGFGVVNEENSGGTLLSTYIHHPGRQIGTVLATSEGSAASSGTWNYYFQDAIGSTRSLWDEDGERLGKYDYTPFGGKYGNTGEEITRKFTGHDWDNEARLYHTAYRQYSPDTGRWLTRDPLGMVDGPNVYAYVVNNPVTIVDTDGRLAFIPLLFGMAIGSLGIAALFHLWLTGYIKAGFSMAVKGQMISFVFEPNSTTVCYSVVSALYGGSFDLYFGTGGIFEIMFGMNKFVSVGFLGDPWTENAGGIACHIGAGKSIPVVNGSATLFCFDAEGLISGSGVLN